MQKLPEFTHFNIKDAAHDLHSYALEDHTWYIDSHGHIHVQVNVEHLLNSQRFVACYVNPVYVKHEHCD